MATIYTGRTIQTTVIEVEQAGFNRCPLRSSGVFSWGQTPGHGETAHALLCAACGISVALKHRREFDREIVAKFGPDWKMSGDDIRAWVRCREDAATPEPGIGLKVLDDG